MSAISAHDCDVAGRGIVVVPQNTEDQAYAETIADQLAEYVWNKRHEFHYTGLTAQPDEALKMALECEEKPVFITDSGDNVTSGATGWNTFVLRQVLAVKPLNKRFLFATICDPQAYEMLAKSPEGTETQLQLGVAYDEYSAPVDLEVTVKSKGELRGFMYRDHSRAYGYCVTVSVKDLPIDIMVASNRQAMVEIHQFTDAGIQLDDYDVIVVKQGYIFPELKAAGKLCVMSLTGGATRRTRPRFRSNGSCGRCFRSIRYEVKTMKILAAKFTLEANEHVPMFCDLENTALSFGEEALTHMRLGDVFDRPDIELIPFSAPMPVAAGVMRKGRFDYLEQRIMNAVREHLNDLDGIYLHLHGASFVEKIGAASTI